jgi:hypothetical protein
MRRRGCVREKEEGRIPSPELLLSFLFCCSDGGGGEIDRVSVAYIPGGEG